MACDSCERRGSYRAASEAFFAERPGRLPACHLPCSIPFLRATARSLRKKVAWLEPGSS